VLVQQADEKEGEFQAWRAVRQWCGWQRREQEQQRHQQL
jgi:hypothetical protein